MKLKLRLPSITSNVSIDTSEPVKYFLPHASASRVGQRRTASDSWLVSYDDVHNSIRIDDHFLE